MFTSNEARTHVRHSSQVYAVSSPARHCHAGPSWALGTERGSRIYVNVRGSLVRASRRCGKRGSRAARARHMHDTCMHGVSPVVAHALSRAKGIFSRPRLPCASKQHLHNSCARAGARKRRRKDTCYGNCVSANGRSRSTACALARGLPRGAQRAELSCGPRRSARGASRLTLSNALGAHLSTHLNTTMKPTMKKNIWMG